MSEFEPMYSIEAEMAALGSMILSERAADELRGILAPRDFWRPAHKTLFATMAAMIEEKVPIDLVTLVARLKSVGELANVGGQDYLTLLDLEVPSAAASASYAKIVLDHSKRRQAEESGRRIVSLARSGANVEEIMTEAASIGHHLSFGGNAVPDVDLKKAVHESLYGKEPAGRPTFFPSIDTLYCRDHGGMADSQVTLFQAKTGKGKSTTMLSMAFPALAKGERVVIGTFADLSEKHFQRRAARYFCGFGHVSECRTDNDRRDFDDAADRVHGLNWGVFNAARSHGAGTVEGFRSWLLRDAEKNGPPTRVILDYAQTIGTQNRDVMGHPTSRNQYVSNQVRLLAEEVGGSFMVGCQVTPKDGGEVVAKHASDWEDHVAMVILVQRGSMRITKNRFGVDEVDIPTHWSGLRGVVTEAMA